MLFYVPAEEPLEEERVVFFHLGLLQCVVIAGPFFIWDVEHWEPLHVQYEVHHQPAHPAIAVGEGMDCNEPEMDEGGELDWVAFFPALPVPLEEVREEGIHLDA